MSQPVAGAGREPTDAARFREPFAAERTAVWCAILGTQRKEVPGIPETRPTTVEEAKAVLDALVAAALSRAAVPSTQQDADWQVVERFLGSERLPPDATVWQAFRRLRGLPAGPSRTEQLA
jgi:hypothetical protein